MRKNMSVKRIYLDMDVDLMADYARAAESQNLPRKRYIENVLREHLPKKVKTRDLRAKKKGK